MIATLVMNETATPLYGAVVVAQRYTPTHTHTKTKGGECEQRLMNQGVSTIQNNLVQAR